MAFLSALISVVAMSYAGWAAFPYQGLSGLFAVLTPPRPGLGPFFWFPALAVAPLIFAVRRCSTWPIGAVLALACVAGFAANARYILYGSSGPWDYLAGAFVSSYAHAVGWVGYLAFAAALIIGRRLKTRGRAG